MSLVSKAKEKVSKIDGMRDDIDEINKELKSLKDNSQNITSNQFDIDAKIRKIESDVAIIAERLFKKRNGFFYSILKRFSKFR